MEKFDDLYELTTNPMLVINLEHHIYSVARRISAEDTPYESGYWVSVPLGDGFVFELQEKMQFHIVNPGNYTDVKASAKCFSLIVFVIALSEYSMFLFEKYSQEERLLEAIVALHDELMSRREEYLEEEEDREAFFEITD